MTNIKCLFGHKVLDWEKAMYTRYTMDGDLYKTMQAYVGICTVCHNPVTKRVRVS